MLQLSLSLITGLFGMVLYPSLKKFKDEGGDVKSEYSSILGIISFLNFPIGAVLILIPVPFVQLLWGENWIQVADLLPYFGLLIFFQTMISTTGHIYILLERERTFMIVGVISAALMVAAIITGAFFSMEMVVVLYSSVYMLIIVPYHLYIGFVKTFGFDWSYIIRFWVPKLLIGAGLLISIYFYDYINQVEINLNKQLDLSFALQIALVTTFLIHLIYFQRNELGKLHQLIRQRFKS